MGIAISTAGVKVKYAVEATAGTKPATAFTEIPDIKEVPEMNPEPETLESTTLSETEFKTYVEGLKDLGGALSFLANFTAELQTAWDGVMTAYAGLTGGKSMWFEISHPKLAKSVFFKGQPSAMGMPSMGVNSILETNLYITPNSAPKWETKSA